MITTTKHKLFCYSEDTDQWREFTRALDAEFGESKFGEDTPVPFEFVLDRLGFADALALLETVKEHDHAIRFFACWCAKEFLLPIHEGFGGRADKCRAVIGAAEAYSTGVISINTFLEIAEVPPFPIVDDCPQPPWEDDGSQSPWEVARFPAHKAATSVVLASIRASSRDSDDVFLRSGNTGQIVSETDTAAIEFCKKCRLKYHVIPANTPSDKPLWAINRDRASLKIAGEFRRLCRLRDRYAQFAPTPAS